ncbi:MAG: AAA family ATPase [Verrucomicrobia bacterium]|nr:AAA family ATPase [Verrucomicrobiota bacterium]
MMKFIGRKKELEKLLQFKKKRTASLIVIHGRRRIGKSRLIEELAREFPKAYIFSGLPPEVHVNEEIQRKEFITQMQQQGIPRLGQDSWSDLFLDVANHSHKGPVLIALDEITWMGSADPAFLGKLKTAWDLHYKTNPQLMLVISGSNSMWIEENILNSTGFVGRISYRLKLDELPLSDCKKFFPPEISAYEIFKVLSVIGGIPRYLEEIQPGLTAERNICDLCFDAGGLLFNEFTQLFSSLFSRRAGVYAALLDAMKEGAKSLKELSSTLGRQPGGDLVKYLKELQEAGFIQRYRQWKLADPNKGELYRYRISDNYTRFYLKFIAPRKAQIEQTGRAELPSGWLSMMGIQFESLVVNHHTELEQILKIPLNEIISSGPYFQTKTKLREGCQIDYLIQTRFDVLYVCEIRFSKKELGSDVVCEMQEKIARLARPSGMSIRPVLVHVNGVTDELLEKEYFAHIVNFSDLLTIHAWQ